jgi:hypothetical protein
VGVDAERFTRLAEGALLSAALPLGRYGESIALWRGESFAELDLVGRRRRRRDAVYAATTGLAYELSAGRSGSREATRS